MKRSRFQLNAAMIGLAAFTTTPTRPQAVTSDAQERVVYALLREQRFGEAEGAAREALTATPKDCGLNTFLGLALRGEGRSEEALRAFEAAVLTCPGSLAALEGAAEVSYSEKDPGTRELLLQLLTLQPQNGTARAMLATTEARAGDCEAAVRDYESAASQIAGSAPALRQYGECLLVLGRSQGAVNTFDQLLALQDSPANRVALARVESMMGERKDALSTLEPLLGAASKDHSALLAAAQIAEADNNTPQAISWLRQAISIAPRNVDNYLYFAEISFNHGSYQVGIDLLNVGLKEIPNQPRLLLARGVLEVQLANSDAALNDFERAHRLDPKLSLADDAIGVLFSQQHDGAAALALFEQKSKTEPNDPLVQYLYAEALSENSPDEGRIETAIRAVRKSLALEPSYQPARDLLCLLLLRHGELDEVVKTANEAMRLDPYDEIAIYQALLAERRLKHLDKVEALVLSLQAAKSHNQVAITKYALQEPGSPAAKP